MGNLPVILKLRSALLRSTLFTARCRLCSLPSTQTCSHHTLFMLTEPIAFGSSSAFNEEHQYCMSSGWSLAMDKHSHTALPEQKGQPVCFRLILLQRLLTEASQACSHLAALRPALLILPDTPTLSLFLAAACQVGEINAPITAGMDLLPDVWELVLHQPALWAWAPPFLIMCANWTSRTLGGTSECIEAVHCPCALQTQDTFLWLEHPRVSASMSPLRS